MFIVFSGMKTSDDFGEYFSLQKGDKASLEQTEEYLEMDIKTMRNPFLKFNVGREEQDKPQANMKLKDDKG